MSISSSPGQHQWLGAEATHGVDSLILARDLIDIEGKSGVNARIVLVAYSGISHTPTMKEPCLVKLQDPIIDMPALAFSHRVWQHVFPARSEEGEPLLK